MKNTPKISVSIKFATTPVSCSNRMMLNVIVLLLLFDYTCLKDMCLHNNYV